MSQQDLQNFACVLLFLLQGLIRVSICTQCNGCGLISLAPELLREQRLHIGFVEDGRFKIEPGRQIKIGMCGSGEAVHAAVLTALVGINRLIKIDVW